jgi:hypothetical protein
MLHHPRRGRFSGCGCRGNGNAAAAAATIVVTQASPIVGPVGEIEKRIGISNVLTRTANSPDIDEQTQHQQHVRKRLGCDRRGAAMKIISAQSLESSTAI